jgi:hypothetical protein
VLKGEELLEEEPELRLALSCCNTVAPFELGATEASSDSTELAAELSPAPKASTAAWISSAISFGLAELVVLVELTLFEDTALCAVEFRVCTSFCAELRSPFSRSVPNRFSSLTKALELVDEAVMSDSVPVLMPLAEVVAVEAVTPFCASSESVTQSCCAADRFPLFTSVTSWFKSVTNWFAVDDDPAIWDKRLLVIVLTEAAFTYS